MRFQTEHCNGMFEFLDVCSPGDGRRSRARTREPRRHESDDVIQTIIKRIKTQVPDDEQVSQRVAPRKQRSRSEPAADVNTVASAHPADGVASSSAASQQPSSDVSTLPSADAAVTCKLCGERCSGTQQEHAATCSYLTREHMCDECGKAFTSSDALTSHLRWHDSMRALTCKQCGKVCKNSLLLKLHLEMHASGKFRCSSCDKSFLTRGMLEKHDKEHVKQKQQQPQLVFERSARSASSPPPSAGRPAPDGDDDGCGSNTPAGMIPQQQSPGGAQCDAAGAAGLPASLQTEPAGDVSRECSPDVQIIDDPSSETCKCLVCGKVCGDRKEKMRHLLEHFRQHADQHKLTCVVGSLCSLTWTSQA